MRLALIALCALAVDAAASTPRHALRWTRAPGADGCTDADALSAAVEARLGRNVFVRGEKPAITIEGQVSPGWHVTIAVRDAQGVAIGERVLDEPSLDCRALDEALVLVIALIIDPNAALREPPAPAKPREPWRFSAGASLLGGAGRLPGAAVGGSARFAIDPPAVPRIEARGTWWVPDETVEVNQGGRFTAIAAALTVRFELGTLDLGAGFEATRLTARGIGFDRVQNARSIVPAAVLDPCLVLAITERISFRTGVLVWIPLVRPRFTFEQSGQEVLVYQPAPAAAGLHAGVDLRF
jgi:hypothetical protein